MYNHFLITANQMNIHRTSSSIPLAKVITLTLFTISLRVWLLSSKRQKRRRRRRRRRSQQRYDEDEHDDDDSDDIQPPHSLGHLGSRGTLSLKRTTPSYWSDFLKCIQDPCDPIYNPHGYIALCLAENKIVQEYLALRLIENPGTAINAFSDSVVYSYNGFLGLLPARESVAYFLERWMLLLARPQPMSELERHVIDCDHIALASGVGSLISHVLYLIADVGDVVLIPAPYYTGYDHQAKAIAGCKTWPVYMKNRLTGPDVDDLERAARLAEKEGLHVKALLLTNPNDPLGIIYSSNIIQAAISWARRRRMHVLVDEVYALSTHTSSGAFESVLRILNNTLGDDVHYFWGLSKDFGASGWRVGILYSQNKSLMSALANLNIFSCVSQPMQMIVADILMDDDFVKKFLDTSRSLLLKSYKICTRKLDEMVIPYIRSSAGLFIYVDFSSLLPEPSIKGEIEFQKQVQESAKLVMTPGCCLNDNHPGMFRLCYASVSIEVLKIAMERLSDLVLKIRRGRST